MTTPDIDAKRQELYRKLNEIVDEFVAINNEPGEAPAMATAHVLLIGTDVFDDAAAGSIHIHPAGGRQATWKTSGILNMAKNWLES